MEAISEKIRYSLSYRIRDKAPERVRKAFCLLTKTYRRSRVTGHLRTITHLSDLRVLSLSGKGTAIWRNPNAIITQQSLTDFL